MISKITPRVSGITKLFGFRCLVSAVTCLSVFLHLVNATPALPDSQVFEPSEDEFVARDTTVYRDLSPHFPMPDIVVPAFPDRDFVVSDFGGSGDGTTLNTDAFRQAIKACSDAGGGRVVVPLGKWLTGSIHLRSNVNLHLMQDATLIFSRDLDHYLPVVFTRWEGMECYNYAAPIYGNGLSNVAITGEGTIDGQGDFWWDWKSTQGPTVQRLYQMVVAGVPPSERVFGTAEDALRPNLVQLISCRDVLIENVTLKNGPMWTIHPVYCSNMVVRGIKVKTTGPNNDGINPDSSSNIVIEDSYFSTGDDCVVLKAGLNEDGWRVGRPTENIIIRRVFAHKGHGGIVIGSEMSGGVRNVYATDNRFDGTDRGFRMKSMRGRGGIVEHIWFEGNRMRNMGKQAVHINQFYESSTVMPATTVPPVFRNITIRDIDCDGAPVGIEVLGLPELPVNAVTLENIRLRADEGVRVKDAVGLVLRNLQLQVEKPGPAFRFHQVRGSSVNGVRLWSLSKPWIELSGPETSNNEFKAIVDGSALDALIGGDARNSTFGWE